MARADRKGWLIYATYGRVAGALSRDMSEANDAARYGADADCRRLTRLVARQTRVVATFQAMGRDTATARMVLVQLEQSLARAKERVDTRHGQPPA